MRIYIISGKAKSGKDTAANLIKDIYTEKKTIKIAYASYLKEYAKNILGWDGSNETKPRAFLQYLGVELIKNTIDDKMLIRRILEDIKVYSNFYDIIIISDARMPEEIDDIKANYKNVTTIHINSIEQLKDKEKEHLTEVGLDNYKNYDYVINNDYNLDNIKSELEKIVSEVESNE